MAHLRSVRVGGRRSFAINMGIAPISRASPLAILVVPTTITEAGFRIGFRFSTGSSRSVGMQHSQSGDFHLETFLERSRLRRSSCDLLRCQVASSVAITDFAARSIGGVAMVR
jgi:hypothetical protein